MAKIRNKDYSIRHGKLSKDSDVVYRVRNGKEQAFILQKSSTPPSKAQKAHRSLFGKVTSIVNAIIADPAQTALWEQKRIDYNRSIALDPLAKRYRSTRSYAHMVITEQLEQKESAKRRRKPVAKALPKGLKLHVKHFAELSTTELYEILKARFAVFYMEQHIYYQDFDNIDYSAIHLALHRKGQVIAYARIFPSDEPGKWFVGRLLTTERGKGFGAYIMEQVALEAKRNGASSLSLHAQIQAAPFYEKLGYKPFGDTFEEAGIIHIQMIKQLV